MGRIMTLDGLRAERRSGKIEIALPYMIGDGVVGEMRSVPFRLENGAVEILELGRPIGELLTTSPGQEALIQKTVVDLQLGREEVPLLYRPIYRTIEDRNFTRNVEIRGLTNGRAQSVFLEYMEGEEVRFGARTFGTQDTVPIITYTTGFQITEDMRVYDQSWEVSQQSRAIGEAYNALLNHVHLYPIISFAYAAANQTPADATAGATLRERTRNTLVSAFQAAASDTNNETRRGRRPTVLLAHSSRRFQIEDAIQRMLIDGTEYAAFTAIDTFIYYDGYSITVGETTYTYGGCPTNKGYLIEPSTYFRELIKHDLLVTAGNPDVSRLIEEQIVARARRGVFASPEKAVEEITWPD